MPHLPLRVQDQRNQAKADFVNGLLNATTGCMFKVIDTFCNMKLAKLSKALDEQLSLMRKPYRYPGSR